MIVKKGANRVCNGENEFDISGPQGNAFAIMALGISLGKELGMDIDNLINRMGEKDYEHLLEVFDEEFGDFITLFR